MVRMGGVRCNLVSNFSLLISLLLTEHFSKKKPAIIYILSYKSKTFQLSLLQLIYSEKATIFCKISTADLSYVLTVKSTVEISQNFVAFSEYMNFTEDKWGDSVSQRNEVLFICRAVASGVGGQIS